MADGNWKLKYPHCMWKVPIEVEGFQNLINYPSICPHSPVRGQAFCTLHCEMAKSVAIPHGIHDFLKYCGLSGTPSFFLLFLMCQVKHVFQSHFHVLVLNRYQRGATCCPLSVVVRDCQLSTVITEIKIKEMNVCSYIICLCSCNFVFL